MGIIVYSELWVMPDFTSSTVVKVTSSEDLGTATTCAGADRSCQMQILVQRPGIPMGALKELEQGLGFRV